MTSDTTSHLMSEQVDKRTDTITESDEGHPLDEVHEAQVSTFEIELLCKHWARERCNLDGFGAMGCWGGAFSRSYGYANARLRYFDQFLGEDRVNAIIAEEYEDFDPEALRKWYKELCSADNPSVRSDPDPGQDRGHEALGRTEQE